MINWLQSTPTTGAGDGNHIALSGSEPNRISANDL